MVIIVIITTIIPPSSTSLYAVSSYHLLAGPGMLYQIILMLNTYQHLLPHARHKI